MKLKEFLENIVNISKTKITALAGTELANEAKKEKLDKIILEYVQTYIDKVKVNLFVKLIIKKTLIPLIPTLTQLIYDLIKTKVQGITK